MTPPAGGCCSPRVAHERVLRGGTATEVRTLAARALDGGLIAEQTGDSGLVMDAGFAAVTAGDLERADRCWDEALADVRRRGSVIGFARTSCLRALLRLAQGRLLDAESDARNAIAAAWEPGYRIARMAHGPLVEALVAQGELAAADAALATAGLDGDLPDNYMLNFVLFARGKLRLAQGRDAEGIADLEELGRRETKWRGATQPSSRTARCSPSPARPTGPVWSPRSSSSPAPGAPPAPSAGRCAPSLSSGVTSTAIARASRCSTDRHGGSSSAHSLIELGAAIRRAGQRTAAPRTAARRDGSRPHLRRRTTRRTGAGGAPGNRRPPASDARRSGIDALTATERRVAEMAASGLTNRQIAQAMFVTTRTVEVHLTHAYQKLGITSRDHLRGLLTPRSQ